jgi:hypothetical protein
VQQRDRTEASHERPWPLDTTLSLSLAGVGDRVSLG